MFHILNVLVGRTSYRGNRHVKSTLCLCWAALQKYSMVFVQFKATVQKPDLSPAGSTIRRLNIVKIWAKCFGRKFSLNVFQRKTFYALKALTLIHIENISTQLLFSLSITDIVYIPVPLLLYNDLPIFPLSIRHTSWICFWGPVMSTVPEKKRSTTRTWHLFTKRSFFVFIIHFRASRYIESDSITLHVSTNLYCIYISRSFLNQCYHMVGCRVR